MPSPILPFPGSTVSPTSSCASLPGSLAAIFPACPLPAHPHTHSAALLPTCAPSDKGHTTELPLPSSAPITAVLSTLPCTHALPSSALHGCPPSPSRFHGEQQQTSALKGCPHTLSSLGTSSASSHEESLSFPAEDTQGCIPLTNKPLHISSPNLVAPLPSVPAATLAPNLTSVRMARTRLTARMSTAPRPSPLPPPSSEPLMAPSSRNLASTEFPGELLHSDSHQTPPDYPIPSGIDEIESQPSTSATSPLSISSSDSSPHNPNLDHEASSRHLRTRSLSDIYAAMSFSAVIEEESCIDLPPDPLEDDFPISIKDALLSSEGHLWKDAIYAELQALTEADTWDLVPPPEHHNIISCKWLLKKKFLPDGSLDRFKARLVARGFTQRYGVDYFETYSPVLGMASLRLLVAVAAKYNLPLHHLDVKTAFLHGKLCETVYMPQPPHFANAQLPHYVCRLKKPIYGLKQSSRQWYTRMHEYLLACGWERLNVDYNVYLWHSMDGIALLGLFVDDIPLIGTTEIMVLRAIDCLQQEFPITDKGPMTYFLGIEVKRDPNGKYIRLSQLRYIEELVFYYNMSTCSFESSPLPLKHNLAPEFHAYTLADSMFWPSFHYPRFCGQIRYLISCTRFDLCYTGHILSRSMSRPCKVHKQAAKRTLRYLNTTKNHALTYTYDPHTPMSFHGYVDSNWAGDDPRCFSTGGYVFLFAGAPISWQTKRQASIAFSSTEAEYVSAALASHEALWLSELLHEFQLPYALSDGPVLRTDHGGEYTSTDFCLLCHEAGIRHEFSIAAHPQQNGSAERKNRTLFDAARALLFQAQLGDSYWEEATATACYIQNRIPSTRNPHTTPYTLWYGHPPNLGHLRIFGCPAYPLEPHPASKLAPRASRAIFVGYGDRFGIKAYRLHIPNRRTFIFSRSIIFDEDSLLSLSSTSHYPISAPLASSSLAHTSPLLTGSPISSSEITQPYIELSRNAFITSDHNRLREATPTHTSLILPSHVNYPQIDVFSESRMPSPILPFPGSTVSPTSSCASLPGSLAAIFPACPLPAHPHTHSAALLPTCAPSDKGHTTELPLPSSAPITAVLSTLPCTHALPSSALHGCPPSPSRFHGEQQQTSALKGCPHTLSSLGTSSASSHEESLSFPAEDTQGCIPLTNKPLHISSPNLVAPLPSVPAATLAPNLTSVRMARTRLTARMSTAPRPSPLPPPSSEPLMAPSSRNLASTEFPGELLHSDSHQTPPDYPIPSGIDEIESQPSTSATSPLSISSSDSSPHNPNLDHEASSRHLRTRSLSDIYAAMSFSAVIEEESCIDLPPDPLEDDFPISIKDALLSSEGHLWKDAIYAELQALTEADTWDLVPPPEHHNIISCKWLLKKKFLPDGSLDRFKARLVARGFTQRYGVDYFETYSPVLGMASLRLLVAVAAKYNLPLHHLDVKTAFLHGKLCETVYMPQPPHFANAQLPHYVCRLKKPIYGLKQSSRQWYTRMHEYLLACGWERLNVDYNVYLWHSMDGIALLGLFVDDILLIGTTEIMVLRAIDCLQQEFPITDKGPMTYFLGIEVKRDPNGKYIRLSQLRYIEELVVYYNMSTCSFESSPLPLKHNLAPEFHAYTLADSMFWPSFHYPRFCGQIRYLISCTRFDLCYTGHILSRSMSRPCKVHKQAAKRTLRYLNTTKNHALTYTYDPHTPMSFHGYVDSNWAGDDPRCFSTGGYVFLFAGAPISWQTKRQASIAFSSTEAEYVSAALASHEALWLSELLHEFQLSYALSDGPVCLFCDNQSTITLSESPRFSAKLKHVCISYHFLKELVTHRFLRLCYVPTAENWADFLTKSVSDFKHTASCRGLSLLSPG
ncbi:hypothetical protein L7F22_011454 [Adiantum nelumboides]|nr:hypothetical protein [Adiantum nelumboides]